MPIGQTYGLKCSFGNSCSIVKGGTTFFVRTASFPAVPRVGAVVVAVYSCFCAVCFVPRSDERGCRVVVYSCFVQSASFLAVTNVGAVLWFTRVLCSLLRSSQ